MQTNIPTNKLTPIAINFIKRKTGLKLKTSDEACQNQKVIDMV